MKSEWLKIFAAYLFAVLAGVWVIQKADEDPRFANDRTGYMPSNHGPNPYGWGTFKWPPLCSSIDAPEWQIWIRRYIIGSCEAN